MHPLSRCTAESCSAQRAPITAARRRTCALDGGPDGHGSESGRGEAAQRAGELADGRAGEGHEHHVLRQPGVRFAAGKGAGRRGRGCGLTEDVEKAREASFEAETRVAIIAAALLSRCGGGVMIMGLGRVSLRRGGIVCAVTNFEPLKSSRNFVLNKGRIRVCDAALFKKYLLGAYAAARSLFVVVVLAYQLQKRKKHKHYHAGLRSALHKTQRH